MARLLCIYLLVIASVLSQPDFDDDIRITVPVQYCDCEINVCAHGDDDCSVAISLDGGLNYNLPTKVTDWYIPLQWQYNQCISTDTRLRFEVEEDGGTVGGFIAAITLKSLKCGEVTWITKNDITTIYDTISTIAGTGPITNYVYTDLGDYPHGALDTCMNMDKYPGIQWVWNGQLDNTMTYIFSFADKENLLKECCPPNEIIVLLPALLPAEQKPTRSPSVAPTIDDCCYEFESLETYVDQCYCNSSNTYTTTSAPVPTRPHTVSDMDNAQQSNVNGQFQQDIYSFMKRHDAFMINYNQNKRHNDYIMYGFVGVNIILVMMNICCVLSYNNKKYRKKGYIQAMEDVDVDVEQDELVRT